MQTQNDLGNVLLALGQRESETTRLEAAINEVLADAAAVTKEAKGSL